MNFFGHATVACWRTAHPAFVLGAMLPDFARMADARLPTIATAEIAEGVRWHHRTDTAFHACPTFLELCRTARVTLRQGGLERGSTLAAAHVGIELLLDGLLLDDESVTRAYLEALETAKHLASSIGWRSIDEAHRFSAVVARLLAEGAPLAYREPSAVAHRLYRILASRPRVAFDRQQVPQVTAWARTAHHELRNDLPILLGELRDRLSVSRKAPSQPA
jgi:hypothetical protein